MVTVIRSCPDSEENFDVIQGYSEERRRQKSLSRGCRDGINRHLGSILISKQII